jgi:hypothetical protein
MRELPSGLTCNFSVFSSESGGAGCRQYGVCGRLDADRATDDVAAGRLVFDDLASRAMNREDLSGSRTAGPHPYESNLGVVAMITVDLRNVQWRKSNRSNGQGANGNCVEIAYAGPAAAVRDSKNTTGPVLAFPAESFATSPRSASE